MFWQECRDKQEKIVEMRRALHRIPELGFELLKTRAYVTAQLNAMGIPYVLSEKDSGLLATVRGEKTFGDETSDAPKKRGKVIVFRADMDALPIEEATGLPFASEHPGCMHACGHDAHTAMLLCAAEVLNAHKDAFDGEIRFLFQSNEESAKGAEIAIENGFVKDADAIFGTHIGTILDPSIPTGTFVVCLGPVMASCDRFEIRVKGAGCHGSTPEKGIDPVNIAAHIVIALEEIIAREFNANEPAVVTVCHISGGAAYNAIPEEVLLEGTTRTFDARVRGKIEKRIGEIARATAAAFGGTADYVMDHGNPPLINDPEMAALAAEAVREIVGEEHLITYREYPNMGGEDFAFYMNEAPGAFLFLSSSDPEKGTTSAHHSPTFDVDEDVLWMGAAAFVNIAEIFLS